MVRNILYSRIFHQANFDALIEIGFRFIKKIAFANLCKAYHNVIVIPFFNFHFGEEQEELQKNIEYLKY